jgi:phosphoserine phosphatase
MTEPLSEKFSIVMPAYNEGKWFLPVVKEALKICQVSELIFVDDGSTDDTGNKIKEISDRRFIYVKHRKNKGKGDALKTGVKKAKNEVILFLDADLKNITTKKIRKIVDPVLYDEVDVSRGSFKLARGRVTEIAVKPMMKILFPDLYFEQPISGQVCAKKSFLKNVNFEGRWGVDIGLLFDAIQAGQRIIEVDIGELKHKARSVEEKAEMAEQVLETMIKKAGLIQHKYRLVVFTLDDTLISKDTLAHIFSRLRLGLKIDKSKEDFELGKITFSEFVNKLTPFFKGVDQTKLEALCQNVPFSKYAQEVVNALKKRKYQVALISSNFSPIVMPLAKRLGIDIIDCIYLDGKDGILNGKVSLKSEERWLKKTDENPFEKAFLRVSHKAKVKPSEAIIVANSPKCASMFYRAGLSVAYRPKDPILKEKADKTIAILPELLAIIE